MKQAEFKLFDESRNVVIAQGNKLPILDGSSLFNIKNAGQLIQFTSASSQSVSWSDYKCTITHHLNCYPIVTVLNNSGQVIFPVVKVQSASTVSLDFEDTMPVGTCIAIISYAYPYGSPTQITTEMSSYLQSAASSAQLCVTIANKLLGYRASQQEYNSLIKSLGSFAVLSEMPTPSSSQMPYVLYVGNEQGYSNMHLYQLINNSGVYSWQDKGAFSASSGTGSDKINYDIVSDVSSWFGNSSVNWNNSEIINNNKRMYVLNYNSGSVINFPNIISNINENSVRTLEVWVKMNGSESNGVSYFNIPDSYHFINHYDGLELKGKDNNRAFTYHVFVLRFIPRTSGTFVEMSYSHYFNTNGNTEQGGSSSSSSSYDQNSNFIINGLSGNIEY